ncbi:hypothetical protein BGW39_007330 [Mortierella sp. 14UC]|nr:hypothetical protein BGW39_007330 [Mortierella sp. 14UC]
MVNTLFAFRIWLAFICSVNFAIIVVFYAWLLPQTNRYLEPLIGGDYVEYFWGDYTTIIASIVLLIAYIFSVLGKPFCFISPRIRAALMIIPALFILGNLIRFMQMGQAMMWVSLVTGIFVVIDVVVTLTRGPLHPPKTVV